MNNFESFHDRHEGLLDPTVLETRRVLVFGAGSVGSVLVEHLVRSGVVHVQIFDFDHVSPSNICRTTYMNKDIGRSKVDALREHLLEIRPGLDIEAVNQDLRTLDDDALVALMEPADLVVAVTDHPPTQARLGAISYHRAPAIFAGAYAKGTGGEVLFTIPDQTACYDCILSSVRGGNGPARGKQNYGIDIEGLAAEPALGIDIAHVTICAAKLALALLLRDTEATAAQILDPSRNMLFVGNAVDWIWQRPFETVWGRTQRRDRCICRIPQGASTADLLEEPSADATWNC